MKIINISDQNYKVETSNNIICIGNFDGVHIGHQKLFEEAQKYKIKNPNLKISVLTFTPHPILFFKPNTNFQELNDLNEKAIKLSKLGVEKIFLAKFDEEFSEISANDFIQDILIRKLNAKVVITGRDYHFGKGRKGNTSLLNQFAENSFFEYESVDLHHFEESNNNELLKEDSKQKISSSNIRDLISEGKIKEANLFLGEEYFIKSSVVKGKGEGENLLGFATANLEFKENQIIPKYGVYNCVTLIDGKRYKTAVNIGVRPSFDDGDKPTIEAHILDFKGDLYGKDIRLEFHDFIRDEIKFKDLLELKNQIAQDVEIIRSSDFV